MRACVEERRTISQPRKMVERTCQLLFVAILGETWVRVDRLYVPNRAEAIAEKYGAPVKLLITSSHQFLRSMTSIVS